MARRSVTSMVLALSLSALGFVLVPAFLAPLVPRSGPQPDASRLPVLMLADTPPAASSGGSKSAPVAGFAIAGALLLAASVARISARKNQVLLRAAAEEPEAPPPPPPFNPAEQLGAMAPLGFFDPAGFSKVGDEAGFNNLRAAEIKHGRVAMLAAVGFVAQQFVKFPGFEKVPSGVGALTTPPGTYGFVALFAFAGAMELAVWTQDENKEPGNFGDPAGLSNIFGYDMDMRAKELNNGRIAMFSAIGILSAELLTGKVGVDQFS